MKKLSILFGALVATTALWAFEVNGIAYGLLGGDSVAVVSKSPKYSGDITIPATVSYNSTSYRVAKIGDWAFGNCDSLTSVTIPNGVSCISNYAFSSCYSLTSVTIPNSVTSIRDGAFRGCRSLLTITIPNSVTSIGNSAFDGCSSLSSITIPSSVIRIGDKAFNGCSSLTFINVDAANTHYVSEDGALFNYAKDTLFQYPVGNTRTSYTIPSGVTSIECDAFFGCSSLTSVTMPNSVTRIEYGAFYNCTSLTSITISNSLTQIENCAFYGCSKLTSFQFPNGLTSIGGSAFHACSRIPSFTIPSSVTSIGDRAFEYCTSLTFINVDAANTHYVSEDGVLFNYAKDTLIQYPIGNARTSYTIPSGVTSIKNYAFYHSYLLTSITIPNSVTSIERTAFYGCTKLTAITCYATTPPTCGGDCFGEVDKSIPVYVPADSISAYKAADKWKEFTNIQAIGAEEVFEPITIGITTPTNNSITITWPTSTEASDYTIVIKKDGEVFCTLTFNAQGQLTNIAFAPGRGTSNDIAMAETVAGGYKFTITGLNPGTKYTYEVDTKNAAGTSIANYSGTFTTMGTTTDIKNANANANVNRKVMKDGKVLIIKDGRKFNAQGAQL